MSASARETVRIGSCATQTEAPAYADEAYAELIETVYACERRARGQVAWTFAAEGSKS